jgi:tetratricopeptide (TPR) repeat protein
MAELLNGHRGRIDASAATDILRDRKLPGGIFAGHGHRGTLNALIATHATVMDLTEGVFWAASAPNQLGRFVAFDVNDFDRELPGRTISADPALATGEFEKARQAQKCIAEAQQDLRAKHAEAALELADKAESLNPGFYQNAALRGRALLALGRPGEAAAAFERALAAQPAFLAERRELEKLLQQARGVK